MQCNLLKLFLLSVLAQVVENVSNIILVVTDDQDILLNGLNPMEKTLQLIANRGVTFTNAYTSSPICCPSRSSILSGRYAHNTKTYNNSVSGGCYGEHWQKLIEPTAFPALLQSAGYKTFYCGKYLNEYYSNLTPPGWDQWYGLHGNSKYYNYTLNENGTAVKYTDEYLTDKLKQLALNFLTSVDEPFFIMIAPPAPHAPYTPAERHANLFPDIKALRTENFNKPFGPLEKHWIVTMPPVPLPDMVISQLDVIYRKRWQSLKAVDEMVYDIVNFLEENQMGENTFIIYTSDNGYHMGQFGLPFDKRQPYETDIKIPFLVKGPGIVSKTLVNTPIALIDIAPTVLEIAGIEIPSYMDGVSLVPKFNKTEIEERQILIEYWGEGNRQTYNDDCPWQQADNLYMCTTEAACHCQDALNNTYHCVRHIASDLNLIYCRFQDNENFAEAYDLKNDANQMHNIAFELLPSVQAKYNLALVNLTECKGDTCRYLY